MPDFKLDGPDQWQAIGSGWDCSIWTSLDQVQGRIAFGPFNKHVAILVPYEGDVLGARSQAQEEAKAIASKIVAALHLKGSRTAIKNLLGLEQSHQSDGPLGRKDQRAGGGLR